jgi:hypothetical protein
VIPVLGSLALAPVLVVSRKAPPFVLLVGDFEPFLSPEPVHPLIVDLETFPPQQRPHLPVAIAGFSRESATIRWASGQSLWALQLT